MLIVACVETGDYQQRGAEYVRKLRAGVAKHLDEPHVFRVYTDNLLRHWPELQRTGIEITELKERGLTGWWNKIQLFRPESFMPGDRVLFFDLDTLIIGSLDELVKHRGLLHLGMWGWQKNDYGTGVMLWKHGEHSEVWARFNPKVARQFRGDQDWMTHLGGWDALPPPPLLCSAKYHCKEGPPAGASVVCFHGPVKPHNTSAFWARSLWGALP